jgi:excisionase family DNA binding protein
LAHGAKRHLGHAFAPGLTLAEVAARAGVRPPQVAKAIRAGVLPSTGVGQGRRVSKTECARWIARKCTTGNRAKSWISLAFGCKLYGFSPSELQAAIVEHRLPTSLITNGPARGQRFLSRYAVAQLRARLGYTHAEAAARLRVTPARLRVLLRGLEWRPAPRIPALVIKNVEARLKSQSGASLAECARVIGRSLSWVEAQIRAGHVRVSRVRWSDRRYLTFPMFRRLCDLALERPATAAPRPSAEWLRLSQAAKLAGVSQAQVCLWAKAGEVRVNAKAGDTHAQVRGYHRRSVMARARRYWQACRFRRAIPPAWLRREQAAADPTKAAA